MPLFETLLTFNEIMSSEPPATGVGAITITPDYTGVTLSWDAVEGATTYTVSVQAAGASEWTLSLIHI